MDSALLNTTSEKMLKMLSGFHSMNLPECSVILAIVISSRSFAKCYGKAHLPWRPTYVVVALSSWSQNLENKPL